MYIILQHAFYFTEKYTNDNTLIIHRGTHITTMVIQKKEIKN